ncbi:MAG: EAL domain-containing protein [Bacilli bacterium]|nr:EAL domain-containing protein [Bacilli bacterium]
MQNTNVITKLKRTILIVDDEFINLEILSEILQDEYDIVTAENGLEALQALRSSVTPISLIMLDINMPVMDGLTMLRAVKEDEQFKHIPVIVLTSERESELESLELGAADFIKKPYDMPEIVHARVKRSIELSEDRLVIQEIERDEVTGVYNKHIFVEYAQKMDKYNPDAHTDLVVINIERYNLIAELHGHEEANEILRCFADALKDLAHDQDGIVGRLQEDIFVLYIKSIGEYDSVLALIDKRLRERFEIINLSNRIGVYRTNDKSEPLEARIDHAKLACEEIRGSNRLRFMVYNDESQKKALFNERLLHEAQEAIRSHQFTVFFQPKFNITGDKPVLSSAEVLVRWIHPELGFISPGLFIPLFENNGIIRLLDKFVWEEAAKQVKQWQKDYGVAVPVSVNVSRVDLIDPNLPNVISEIVKKADIQPENFFLEVTESAYTDDSDQLVALVDEFRSRGFKIEIDDFGSGYSSLATLATLSFDILKLDMQFVRTMDTNMKTRKMVSIVADIAKFLNTPVIAEGVETKEQYEFLKSKGYDIIQGYYFSKPLPAEEFASKYLKKGE